RILAREHPVPRPVLRERFVELKRGLEGHAAVVPFGLEDNRRQALRAGIEPEVERHGRSLPSFQAIPSWTPSYAGGWGRTGTRDLLKSWFPRPRRGRAVPGRFNVCSACASLDCAVGCRNRTRRVARRRVC